MYWQSLFVPDTPAHKGKSSSGGVPHHLTGISPQLPFWQSRPHCVKLWLGGSTIVIPTVIAMPGANLHLQRVFSLGPIDWASWRILLLWLMLSHIGIDVLDECVSSCQGASRVYPQLPTTTFKAQNRPL